MKRKRAPSSQLPLSFAQPQTALVVVPRSFARKASTVAITKRAKAAIAKPRKKEKKTMARVGQFKKGGGRVTNGRKSSGSKSIVRYVPQPVVRYKTRTKTIVKKSKAGGGRSLMRRELGSGEMMPGPYRMRSAAVAGLVGYSDAGKGAAFVKDIIEKIPDIAGVPKEALAGLVLNYMADRGDWFDAGAQALLDIGAYKAGQKGFEFKSSGDDD